MRVFDVIIVGAGPAGLFAAYELSRYGDRLRVLVIDKGLMPSQRRCPLTASATKYRKQVCTRCRPCHMLHGVGGAGALSSGVINLRPDIGGDLDKLLGSWEEAVRYIEYVDSVLVRFGAPRERVFRPDPQRCAELERLAARAGAKLVPAVQRHIGSDRTPIVIENLVKHVASRGVRILAGTEVREVHKAGGLYRVKTDGGEVFEARLLLLAPGRGGAEWFSREAKRLGISIEPGPLDMGVRVEVPRYIMDPVTDVVWDPKIIMYTKAYDDKVRTFCTNPGGFVVEEVYDDGTVGVNGETYTSRSSMNTNFALLVTLRLTDPMEDTIEYGKSIARLSTRLGGGRPLIQRFGDLEAGRRSTWSRVERSSVEPTLRNVTPGDIGMALPYRVVTNIVEAIKRLDVIIPGVASPQTLLYAPEIKYYSVRAVVDPRTMETTADGVFVAGDGAGLSRGINVAAATGVIAARGMASKLGLKEPEEDGIR